jgi:alpha-mannosidase
MPAERLRDALQQSLIRLSNRLGELSAWRDRESLSFSRGEIRISPNGAWSPIKVGDFWPAQAESMEIRFAGLVPRSWAGLPVHSRFHLGGEALLFVDDQAIAGLNSLQDEHPVLVKAQGEETLHFRAEVVPHGLFGTPTRRPQIELACLLVPDTDLRPLYEDLAAALEAARYHRSTGRGSIAEHLVGALQRALARILLPRDETPEYLARIAAVSESRALENFYANQESLASLWENWEFRSPIGSLASEQRESLHEVRGLFARELESIRANYPAEGRVWLTGHAHLDLAWLWPLEETRKKTQRTFQNVLSLMARYPELRFNQSSAQLYAWIEQSDPLLFDKVRARVQDGSWEIVGGTWVEPDGNLLAGESWVRQLLFGQRFFESRFGRRAKVAWLPDSFGFAGNLPQLFASAGMPFFFTHKLTWNERNRFPYDLYLWEGIDGSRILAHSFTNPENGYNSRLTAHEVAETWHNFRGNRAHDSTLLAFGYGDGGGGPSSEMLERFARLRNFPGLPGLRMGGVAEFYERVSSESLPVWVGEQYLEYHRATYTTQSRMKSLHRQLEQALVESEVAASLALVRLQRPYPKDKFDRLWQILLLNQFHDILPGSSIHSVYESAHLQLAAALQEVAQLRTDVLATANPDENSKDRETPEGLVWNLNFDDRPLVAEIEAGEESTIRVLSSNGRPIPTQRLERNRILVVADNIIVPALGAVSLSRTEGVAEAKFSPVRASPGQMENEYLRVQLGENGTLVSIYDQECAREVLAGRGNQLWLFTDIPGQFDAWDMDASYTEEGTELLADSPAELVEQGPLRAALRVTRRHQNIEIVQTYRLRRLSRVLEIHNRIRWCGRRRLLRALFPLGIRTHEMWAETSFGAVARSNHRNTPWDLAKFEVPAHRWVDLSEPSYGVSLLNTGKYGHSADGNVLGLSLLRAPIYPDPFADEGDHEFTYAIYPHRGNWRNGTVRAARELHSPLRYTPGFSHSTGLHSSLLRLHGDPLELACLKRAEDSGDLLLRLYEPHGDRGQTILESALPIERAALVNILEEPLAELPIEDTRRVKISFTPFQVISLRLSLRRPTG